MWLRVFSFFLGRVLVFLVAFLVEFLFSCFYTFLFSFMNSHLRTKRRRTGWFIVRALFPRIHSETMSNVKAIKVSTVRGSPPPPPNTWEFKQLATTIPCRMCDIPIYLRNPSLLLTHLPPPASPSTPATPFLSIYYSLQNFFTCMKL